MATAETHQSSATLNYEWRSENGEMINNGKLHVHMALTLFAGFFFASRSRDSVLLQEKDGYAVQAAKRQNNLIFTSARDAT